MSDIMRIYLAALFLLGASLPVSEDVVEAANLNEALEKVPCDLITRIRMYAMANPASPLDVPLHLDVCILAHSKASSKFRRRRLKRGVFRSVVHLQLAINHFVAETSADPKPLVWTRDPKRVLAAVKRGKQA